MNTNQLIVNKFFKHLLAICFMLSLYLPVMAQQKSDIGFRSPLGFPLLLSGTFGELRSGHLHAGIDIKTGGKEGKKVYAVADGYISRIKISLGGYGKALYITHPNGKVSVYGHLQRFSHSIEKFVREKQYAREIYTVDIFPDHLQFPVKKGQLIAYSGNTGGSEGPHLHFEIRDARTQNPLNPLLFRNIRVDDEQAPKIVRLVIYPVGRQSLINGVHDTALYRVAGHGKHCFIKKDPLIKVYGPISFGIRTYDVMSKLPNHNGVYQIQLFQDSLEIFRLAMNRLTFRTTRFVNSLIDYHYYQKNGKRIVRVQVDSNNRLPEYKKVKNRGVVYLKDNMVHHFKFIVKDAYGNTAILPFRAMAVANSLKVTDKKRETETKSVYFIHYNKAYNIDSGRIRLKFVPNTFYQSFYFHFREKAKTPRSYAPLFVIHNRFVPVQNYFDLAIRPDKVDALLKSKLFIAYIPSEETDTFYFVGNKWKKSWLHASVRNFGVYTVMADTVLPEVKPLNFKTGDTLSSQKKLYLSIRDFETGIRDYRPSLNGHWILMEYDVKSNTLMYNVDKYLEKGRNELLLRVTDQVGNQTLFKTVLYREK